MAKYVVATWSFTERELWSLHCLWRFETLTKEQKSFITEGCTLTQTEKEKEAKTNCIWGRKDGEWNWNRKIYAVRRIIYLANVCVWQRRKKKLYIWVSMASAAAQFWAWGVKWQTRKMSRNTVKQEKRIRSNKRHRSKFAICSPPWCLLFSHFHNVRWMFKCCCML